MLTGYTLRTGQWIANSESMWDSSIMKEASKDSKLASKAYQKQVVEPALLNYQPNELKRAPGVLPEPPVFADPEDRPRADKPAVESNQGIGLLRTYAQQVINANVSSYDRAVRTLLEMIIDSQHRGERPSVEFDEWPCIDWRQMDDGGSSAITPLLSRSKR